MGWGFGDDGPEDPRVLLEGTNGLRQSRRLHELIVAGLASPQTWSLTPEIVCELNRLSMVGITQRPGEYRVRSDIEIAGSSHRLPPHSDVRELVDQMCEELRRRWAEEPLFLASYVMWRICWIHPFDDGNGRTARAVAYLVLNIRLGYELTGSIPIPSRIKHAPRAYWRALEAADHAWGQGALDVSVLQGLLDFYLAAQVAEEPLSLPP